MTARSGTSRAGPAAAARRATPATPYRRAGTGPPAAAPRATHHSRGTRDQIKALQLARAELVEKQNSHKTA